MGSLGCEKINGALDMGGCSRSICNGLGALRCRQCRGLNRGFAAVACVLFFGVLAGVACGGGSYSGGSGDPNDPYLISRVADWLELVDSSADYDKHFLLTADLDFAGVVVTPVAPIPHGYYWDYDGPRFAGVFDGGGHVMRNVRIDLEGKDYVGLFGYLIGNVHDVALEDCDIRGEDSTGGLVGINEHGTISDCSVRGLVTGDDTVGGMVGDNERGVIAKCYASGSVYGRNGIGGLVGWSDVATVTKCSSGGSVSGNSNVGGLVGYNLHGTVTECYSMASVIGIIGDREKIGGLVGNNRMGAITSCYAVGSVSGNEYVGGLVGQNYSSQTYSATISNCFATGAVTGHSFVGGLVGNADANITVTNCYAAGSVSGDVNIGGLIGESTGRIRDCYFLASGGLDNGNGTPLSDEQMRANGSYRVWDFFAKHGDGDEDTWKIIEGVTMPVLSWSKRLVYAVGLEGGEAPEAEVMRFHNMSDEGVLWHIDEESVPGWLEFSALSGAMGLGSYEDVTVNFDTTGLARGEYLFSADVHKSGTEEVIDSVYVGLRVAGPIIHLSEAQFVFYGEPDEISAEPNVLTIGNVGSGVLNWSIAGVRSCGWVSVEPSAGNLGAGESADIVVRADATGFEGGVRSCRLMVSAPGADNELESFTVWMGKVVLVPEQYPTIQAGIDAAVDGDVVILADGIYRDAGNYEIDFGGKAITVRSENGAENCIIDCEGSGRAFYFHSGEGNDSVIDGLTIRNGYTWVSGSNWWPRGGGIYCVGAAPTIMNCRILGCSAIGYSDATCDFFFVDAYGGGVYGCSGPIVNCVIEGNWVETERAGCGDGYGGGLSHCNGPIVDCVIRGNFILGYGNGAALYDCDGDIINCLIADNRGEMDLWYGAALSGCDGNIINCTIAYNLGDSISGWVNENLYDCDGLIRNCIIWGEGVDDAGIINSEAVVEYSDVLGGYEGEGNINVEPMFADVANGDYHLKSAAGRWNPNSGGWVYDEVTSGCIDGGAPGDLWCGEYWPHGGRVNMGAYGGTREASMSLSTVGSAGDLDCDGAVWFYDFGLFGDEWGMDGTEAISVGQGSPYRSDLDRDGVVGLGDLVRFAQEWLGVN